MNTCVAIKLMFLSCRKNQTGHAILSPNNSTMSLLRTPRYTDLESVNNSKPEIHFYDEIEVCILASVCT